MPASRPTIHHYAATYSLLAPVTLSLVLYVLMSIPANSHGPEAVNDVIGISFILTLTAIVAGIFSLFGLRHGSKKAILLKAIPGIVMGLGVAFVLAAIGMFVG